MQAVTERRWVAILVRTLLSLGLVYCIYLVARRAVAEWYFRQPPPEGLRKAIAWDPGNPMYYAALARVQLRSLENTDLREVIHLYETATRLSPNRASYWAELGGAYETVGRLDDARRAYERAQILFPNSPDINWQLGNFYIRIGENRKALVAFQKSLIGDPETRRPAFELAWRATGDPELILKDMIPPQHEICFQYLGYLIETKRLNEAVQAWRRLLALGLHFEPNAAFPYLDALIQNKHVEDLIQAWSALAERNPTLIRRRPFTQDNLIYNGNFENEILNGGLDWRVVTVEGVVVSVDSLRFFDGARSLRIRFDGKHNIDYGYAYQFIPVMPNTRYRFMGYMRAQGITTDQGPRFHLYDVYDPGKLSLTTENLVGTVSWSVQQLEFKTGPETRLLAVRVARPPSRKFDNQIAGTVWIDRLSINAVE